MRLPLFALVAALTFPFGAAFGQTDAGTPDAGTPTDGGTEGEGGSDRDGTEGDDGTGRVVDLCRSSSDCSQGFACANGRCQWSGFRKASTQGCLASFTGQTLTLLGIGAIWLRSRRPR